MKEKLSKAVWLAVLLAVVVTGFVLLAQEEFDRLRPLEGDGAWQIHETQLVPREKVYQMAAEAGKLYVFFNASELLNVYTTQGEFLYGIQFPNGQNGVSALECRENLAYIHARGSGIYIFEGTKLLRFELQSIYNPGHDELETVFTGEANHEDGGFLYQYDESANRITRTGDAGVETVVQFPKEKLDKVKWLLMITGLLAFYLLMWDEETRKRLWQKEQPPIFGKP